MPQDDLRGADRRAFLQAGVAATTAAIASSSTIHGQDADKEKDKEKPIPRRKLGKTGVEVTVLNQGAVRAASLNRIFRTAFAGGIRMFDTAKVYGTEPAFRAWFEQEPEVRKQIFLVTKDTPKEPTQLLKMLDERLDTLKVDYVDLFFVHGLGDMHSTDEALRFLKSPAFKETADKIRKSGKAKFVGFSSHHKDRAAMIETAAETGVVDAIMLQYNPWIEKDSPLNKALDVAHAKGVGLISMKQIAGQFFGDKPKGNILEDTVKRVPMLKEKNLTPFQGLLHAIWTDQRISASCVSMKNTDQIRENIDAARRFEPLKLSEVRDLRDASLAHGPMLCADCDGRCAVAAGTNAALGDLTRFLTYYKHHGDRSIARARFASLAPEAKDWSGADLDAAREACPNRLNFAQLLPEVDKYLA